MYSFPIIYTIDDVLPHIKDWSEIIVAEKDGYTWIDYAVDTGETFSRKFEGWEMRRECRGLFFDDNGIIISRPFHKFFNVNQLDETQANIIDFNRNHRLMTKEDGSMVRPFINSYGELKWATRKGISDTIANMEKDFPDMFAPDATGSYSRKLMEIYHIIQLNKTPCFEYVGPNNFHVVEYDKPRLILLAVRDNITGDYEDIHNGEYDIFDVVNTHESTETIEELLEVIRVLEGTEGVVMAFGNEYYKIKGDDYVLKHKLKEKVSKERHVWEAVIQGKLDDILPRLSEKDREMAKNSEIKFWKIRNDAIQKVKANVMNIISGYATKKDFALNGRVSDGFLNQVAFAIYDGKTVDSMVDNYILKNIGKDSSFSEMVVYLENL